MGKTKAALFENFQKLGKAILLPIAILPVAGLFLGVSAALSGSAVLAAYPALNVPALQNTLAVMNAVGKGVFNALPLIFAVGVSVGMAKREKGVAGLASIVGYFTLIVTINAILTINGKLPGPGINPKTLGQTSQYGIMTLDMGVFGGVLVGLFSSMVHNRFHKLKLPEVLAFFGGSRSVPIITSFVAVLAGVVMYFVWPMIGGAIVFFGSFVSGLGVFGGFLYGLLLRTFYVFGLHHVFYLPFWTTAAGGVLEVGGHVYEGWQTIFLAQLADPTTEKFFTNIAYFNSGKYIHMMFVLPAACFAMYKAIPKLTQRKKTMGFLLSIAFTSFITGVSEPISYAFLFANPILFVAEALLFAISFLITGILNVTIGSTFSAGLVEYLLFGVFQGEAKTGYLLVIAAGIPMAIISYFVFYHLIIKLDCKTPGREEIEEGSDEANVDIKVDVEGHERAIKILEGLGGAANVSELDNCATRLRVTVKKIAQVDQDILKKTGAMNVIVRGKALQIIYGTKVNLIKGEINEYLEEKGIEIN